MRDILSRRAGSSGIRYCFRIVRVLGGTVFCALAVLAAAGCMASAVPVLVGEADVVVPDFSGTYESAGFDRRIAVTRVRDNVFALRLDGDDEPHEAVVYPLDNPDAFLLQLANGEDYDLTVLRIDGESVTVTTFGAVNRMVMLEAFDVRDPGQVSAAGAMMERLTAGLSAHGIVMGEERELLNSPSAADLVAFYNQCLAAVGTLEGVETFTRVAPDNGTPGSGE